MTFNTCPKCGCYIPDNWNKCPACAHVEKQIEEPKIKIEVKTSADDYQTLIRAIYGDKPIGFYPDIISRDWDIKQYDYLKNAIYNYIQWDVGFHFWNRFDIHNIPAFSNVGSLAIDSMLFCLAKEGKIDEYFVGCGWELNYYRRLPQTKQEARDKRKHKTRYGYWR